MQVSSEELKSSGEIHYIKQYQISVIPTPYLEQMIVFHKRALYCTSICTTKNVYFIVTLSLI